MGLVTLILPDDEQLRNGEFDVLTWQSGADRTGSTVRRMGTAGQTGRAAGTAGQMGTAEWTGTTGRTSTAGRTAGQMGTAGKARSRVVAPLFVVATKNLRRTLRGEGDGKGMKWARRAE